MVKILGNTHIMYGFILAELLYWKFVKGTKEQNFYNRGLLWVFGMIGGYLPDLDSLSGVFSNLIFENHPWNIEVFYIYHRHYSHSLGFLIVAIAMVIILARDFHEQHKSIPKLSQNEENHPFGQVPIKKEKSHTIGLVLIFVGFLIYNDYTKYVAYFYLLGAMLYFGFTFRKSKTPLYGVAFFGGSVLHHICDFIQCHWNPFGPWDPYIFVGLNLYCGGVQFFMQNLIPLIVFEFSAHIIVIIMIIRAIREYCLYKRQNLKNFSSKTQNIDVK